MAIYHFSVKSVSRGNGQSVVACSAYRAGEKLLDERCGKEHDYTKKQGVEFTKIYAPENTNPDLLDRSKLWNTVEKVERRKDACLAREFEIAFPHELNAEQRKDMLAELCQELVKRHGVIVDTAIHAPHTKGGSDERNFHAHIMFTSRQIEPQTGDFAKKKSRDFNKEQSSETVSHWREYFADLTNRHLAKHGFENRVDHRSYADQKTNLQPTMHEGSKVTQLRRLGIDTEISRWNDSIKQQNAEKQIIRGLDAEIIASDAILSDLQRSKAKYDAEYAEQQKIAAERKRERLTAQSLVDAQKRATDFHDKFDPARPSKVLVNKYLDDYALLAKHGKEPQPPAPVEQPQPNLWQRITRQQLAPIEQPPFFEIELVKATAKQIVESEQKQAQQEKWGRLERFLGYSKSEVDQLERESIERSFERGRANGKVFENTAEDAELAEFIKYYRDKEQEKAQLRNRFTQEKAELAQQKAELAQQKKRDLDAQAREYRAQVEKDKQAQDIKPTHADKKPQPRSNDFEP